MSVKLLASCAEDCVKLWELNASGLTSFHQYSPHNGVLSDISWRCDGQQLASCSVKSDTVVVTHAKNDFKSIEFPAIAEQQCIHFSRSTPRFLITGGKNGEISVWDLKTNSRKRVYTGHTDAITKVRFNWNDSYILSGSVKGDIILHHAQTGQGSSPLRAPRVQAIRDLRYSPTQRILFCAASDDGAITMWDANTRQTMHHFRGSHNAPATGLAFSPLNNMLMASVGLDKKVNFFDVLNKRTVSTFTCDQPLTAIDIHQDGQTLAVGTQMGRVHVYDLRKHQASPLYNVSASLSNESQVQCVYFATERSKPSNSKAVSRSSSTSPKRFLTSCGTNDVRVVKVPAVHQSNGTSNVRYGHKICSEISMLADRDKIANTTCSSTSSISDEVFSPLRDSPDVRKQPIGSAPSVASPGLLGARSAATGLADTNTSRPVCDDNITVRRAAAPAPGIKRRSSSSSPRAVRQFSTNQKFAHSSPFVDTSGDAPPLKDSSANLINLVDSASNSSQPEEKLLSSRLQAETCNLSPIVHLSELSNGISRLEPKPLTSPLAGFRDAASDSSASQAHHSFVNLNNDLPNLSAASTTSSKTVASGGETGARPSDFLNCDIVTHEAQVECIRKVFEETLDDFQDNIHRDVVTLQVEMLRRFHIQQAEIETLLQRHSLNDALLEEVQHLREEVRHLREENKRLRSKF